MTSQDILVNVCLFTPNGLKYGTINWGRVRKIAEAAEGVDQERRIPVIMNGQLFMSEDLTFTYEVNQPCLN